MSKFKRFFRNLIKHFTADANRDESLVDLEKIAEREQKQFLFQTLVAATNNFSPSLKLGEGGFGPVYQGTLEDGRKLAVKRLSRRSGQRGKEFPNEVKLLARVQHRNVVHLLGYCTHGEEKLLVYEYVPNESLDKLLFKSDSREELDWKRRHDIITGVAKGLRYLHEEAHGCIIHRDIKPSNILLDEKWVPKIADFGMARLYPENETHVNTRIAGTIGYMAPEYLMHNNLSTKSDVFSFGVVVLELISGQKNWTFNRDPDCQNLLEWAYKLYKRQRSQDVMDPALVTSADREQIDLCVHVGLLCVQADPRERPEMDRVVVILSRKPSNLEEPNRPGVPGSRYRRYRGTTGSSTLETTGTSDKSVSSSSESTATRSGTLTGSSPGLKTPRRDPHGKRPVKY